MLARPASIAAVAALLGACASAPRALTDLPVDATQTLPASAYADAARFAALAGATPVGIAMRVAGPFEGRTQHIVQTNEGVEAPTAARVTVVRDGLLDDAVRGDRWDIRLQRTQAGGWRIVEVQRAWRCRRGGEPDRFVAVKCP